MSTFSYKATSTSQKVKTHETTSEAYDPHFPKRRTTDKEWVPESTNKKSFSPYFSTRVR